MRHASLQSSPLKRYSSFSPRSRIPISTLLYALSVLVWIPTHTQAQWSESSKLPRPRTEAASAVVRDAVYLLGGISDESSGYRQVDRFDPYTNSWTWGVSRMPDARHHFTAGASVSGSDIWICGGKTGNDSTGLSSVWVFNTDTLQWRPGPELPEIHWGGPAVIIGRKLHVVGGAVGSTSATQHHFVLDLDDEESGWQTAAPVIVPLVHAAGVELDGRLYVIGGEIAHNHTGDYPFVQVYQPDLDFWYLAASLPLPRSHAEWSTFTHDGKIYSVSGVDSSKTPRGQREIFVYHPEFDHWSTVRPHIPQPGVGLSAKIIRNRLYTFGGSRWDWFFGDLSTVAYSPLEELRSIGDVTGDGVFRSNDLVELFRRGLFEQPRNAGWNDGDWNGDGRFNSADFVLALQYGSYIPY